MAALTTLNITEKNANNSLSVTVKVNVTKEGVTTTLSKEKWKEKILKKQQSIIKKKIMISGQVKAWQQNCKKPSKLVQNGA